MNDSLFFKFIVPILTLLLIGCNSSINKEGETVTVDFSDHAQIVSTRAFSDSAEHLNVAVAAMISPKETFVFYEDLFNYISSKTGDQVVFKQRKTYDEVNKMLENKEVDLAVICSGAYVSGKEKSKMEILVTPVSNGKNNYQAYVVVHVNSPYKQLSDLQNKVFAFSDPISHSGKFYIEKRIKELGYGSNFFSKTIYSNAHDVSMQLVSKQVVDGSSVKGTIYDYLEKFHPERIKNLRIIEKSEWYGMPPIVVPEDLDEQKKEQLRNLFLKIHEDPEGKKILDQILIDKFVIGSDQDYNSIRSILTTSAE